MEQSFLKQMSGFLRDKKNRKRYIAVFLCLALVVSLTTFVSLTMSGNAQNHMVKVLDCKYEAHKHTADCYDKEHPDQLICGYADYAVHIHNDDCYDASGVLVCQLPQIEPHTHDETCYTEEKTLTCELPESEGHVHTEACYTTEQGELTCTVEEHTHSEECYDENGEVICGKEEHTHNEACYEQIQTLTCEIPEGEGAHTHTDDCYVTEKKLTCGKLELHTHTEECYQHDENGKLVLANDAELVLDDEGNPVFDEEHQPIVICGIPVLEEHVHGADCFKTVELTDEEVDGFDTPETSQAPAESESCYDAEGNLTCTKEEHTHTEECYDEAAAEIVCGKEEHTHHTAPAEAPAEAESCYDAEGNLICTKEEHTHTEECYGEDGAEIVCGKEEHTHTAPAPAEAESCYDAEGNLTCTKEEHTHSEECYGEDGALICETEEHTHTGAGESNEPEELTKTYQDSGVVITATYTEAANIPEEAELIAKAVTSETDPELYAQRMEEALQHVTLPEDAETPNMLLYNIGFYVDGEEVEPAAPVTITVQLLNAEGFAVGAPITVVHFAEDGTEVLDGTALNEDSETTFTTDGFSDYGIMPAANEPTPIAETPSSGDAKGSGTFAGFITGVDYSGVTYDPLADEWSTWFSMSFSASKEELANGGYEFDYYFPEGFEVPDSLLNKKYDDSVTPPRFTYEFSYDNEAHRYKVHLKFNENQIGPTVGGTLSFEANGGRKEGSGDLHYDFNDHVSMDVPSQNIKQEYDISVRKEGHYDAATKTLKYTIYVESPHGTDGPIDLNDYLQWESNSKGLKFTELKSVTVKKQTYDYQGNSVEPKDIDYYPSEPGASGDGDSRKFNLHLDQLQPQDGLSTRYVITYEYQVEGDVTAEAAKAKNSVEAKTPGKGGGGSSSVEVKNDVLSKTAWQNSDGTITWKLYVNKSGIDIAGYTLTDEFFDDYGIDSWDDITITPPDNVLKEVENGKNVLKFDADASGENRTTYEITYTTKIEEGDYDQKLVNHAEMVDPKGNPDYKTDHDFTPSKPPETTTEYKPHAKKTWDNADHLYPTEGGKIAQWTVRVLFPDEYGGIFPKGAVFEDKLGNDSANQYMTYVQFLDLLNTLKELGILDHVDTFEITCETYGQSIGSEWTHGGNKTSHPFDFKNRKSLDSHVFNEDCTISGFKFTLQDDVTPDMLNGGKFEFTYKSTVVMPIDDKTGEPSENGDVWFLNDFNGGTAGYTHLYFDTVDKSDGNGVDNNAEVMVDKEGNLVWKVHIVVNNVHEQIIVKDNLPTGTGAESGLQLKKVEYSSTHTENGITAAPVTASWDVPGDPDVGGLTWTYDDSIGESVLTITDPQQTTKKTVIEVVYTCKITDEKTLEALNNGTFEAQKYYNTVTVYFDGDPTSDEDTQTVVGKVDGFSKDRVVQKAGKYDENGSKFTYSVQLNPTGADLLEGVELLDFEDELSYQEQVEIGDWQFKQAIVGGTLATAPKLEPGKWEAYKVHVYFEQAYEIDPNSVKFYKATLNPDTGELKKEGEALTDIAWSIDEVYDSETDTVKKYIRAQVPDGTPLIVEYQYTAKMLGFYARVDGDPTKYKIQYGDMKKFVEEFQEDNWNISGDFKFNVSNTAKLTADLTDNWKDEVDWEFAETFALSWTDGFNVYKVDSVNASNFLAGAEFTLYDKDGTPVDGAEGITTDRDGKIVVSCEVDSSNNKIKYKFTGAKDGDQHDWKVDAEKRAYYFLKETKTPTDYKIPEKERIVVLWYPGNDDTPLSNEKILEKLPDNWKEDGHTYEVILMRMDDPKTNAFIYNEPSPNPGYTLPETGGGSTHMYMLGGAMLLLLAAALAYKAKISGRRVFRG